MAVASALASPVMRAGARVAGPVAAFSVGAAIPAALAWQSGGAGDATLAAAGGGALLFAVAVRLARGRAGTVTLAALVLGATWLVGLLWS
jgi:hypothetical protein